jgi:uncharacterized membrane protein
MDDNRGPLISAATLLGIGLGGFVDGILFHQILQIHNMLTGILPRVTLVNAEINMFWDGLFHAFTWIMTVLGLALLWRAFGRSDVPHSSKTFVGSLILGWGLFNFVEGIINHRILGIHHVVSSPSVKVARAVVVKDEDASPVTREEKGGGKPRRPRADNNEVVKICHHRSAPLSAALPTSATWTRPFRTRVY